MQNFNKLLIASLLLCPNIKSSCTNNLDSLNNLNNIYDIYLDLSNLELNAGLINKIRQIDYDLANFITLNGINTIQSNSFTPLTQAINNQNTVLVELLLNAGANPNMLDKHERFPLIFASAGRKNIEIVKLLINAGADVNFLGKLGTPIACAVYTGKIDIIQALIDAGADLQKTRENSQRPIIGTLLKNFESNQEIAKLLIDNNGNLDSVLEFTDLSLVQLHNTNNNIIELIIAAGASLKDCDIKLANFRKQESNIICERFERGLKIYNELLSAVQSGNLAIILNILNKGYSANIKDKDGNNPMHYAISNQNSELFLTLMAHNPKLLNFKNNSGQTPKDLLELQLQINSCDLKIKSIEAAIHATSYIPNLKEIKLASL